MTDNEGTLRMLPSGRWAVCQLGRSPVAIAAGDLFRVEVIGKEDLQLTRMEYRHGDKIGVVVELPGYYSVDGYHLANGLRAAIGAQD